MLRLEKLADWWDTQKKESEKALDSFVDQNPNLFGVAIAGSARTAMDLGAGFVDVLRIGEGVKRGGWGFGEDALRLVSLVGPAARVGRFGLTKFVPNVAGPLCARVSATQALRMTEASHFAAVDDVVKSLAGKTLTSMADIGPEMQRLRAVVRNLGEIKTLEHVKDLVAANPKGVVTFAVKWFTSSGEEVAHAVVGFRDWIGRVRFLDRSGTVFRTFDELEHAMQRARGTYDGIEKAVPHGEGLHIANPSLSQRSMVRAQSQ